MQQKRDPCPKCGKRGLGPIKTHTDYVRNQFKTPLLSYPYQHCRYCGHCKTISKNQS